MNFKLNLCNYESICSWKHFHNMYKYTLDYKNCNTDYCKNEENFLSWLINGTISNDTNYIGNYKNDSTVYDDLNIKNENYKNDNIKTIDKTFKQNGNQSFYNDNYDSSNFHGQLTLINSNEKFDEIDNKDNLFKLPDNKILIKYNNKNNFIGSMNKCLNFLWFDTDDLGLILSYIFITSIVIIVILLFSFKTFCRRRKIKFFKLSQRNIFI